MGKIKTLSTTLISQIAAGEVIERPSYAVKELIENAIDANAESIELYIEESGLRKITVIDNGEGMGKDDLMLCFLPHTTSKLKEEEDLVGIKTFGFRGEALASLASIATLTIKSRQKGAVSGTMVHIASGQVKEIVPVGMPEGTQCIVEYLFESVPVRKKFLKSQQTEFRHILDVVGGFVLAYPAIRFRLFHNGKEIFSFGHAHSLQERIQKVLGESFLFHSIPVSYEEGHITISGYVGKPSIARKLQQKQILFVNRRLVTDRMISLSVKESYASLLPLAMSPVFLLYVTVAYEAVDVNVHPRKEKVKFLNEMELFSQIKLAVSQTLVSHNITFSLGKFSQYSEKKGETTTIGAQLVKNEMMALLSHSDGIILSNTYFVGSTQEGIIVIDLHAAHERILFETLLHTFIEKKKTAQSIVLAHPLQISFSLAESYVVEEYKDEFEKIGFEIEQFVDTTYSIRSIPALFQGRNVEKIIGDMVSDLIDAGSIKQVDVRSQRMLAFLACRSAVKAGDTIEKETARSIFSSLMQVANNQTCPHGRPTRFELSLSELASFFKR